LAGHKRPKVMRFVTYSDLPRRTGGKIRRRELERRLP